MAILRGLWSVKVVVGEMAILRGRRSVKVVWR